MGISKLLFIFRLPKRLLLPLLAALVIGGSYLGYQRVFASRNGEVEKFQTVDVARDTIVARVSASGPTKPLRSADLSFRSGGWVKEVLVSVGDKVAQGQPLATLEARDLELAVKRAEANLAIAKARLASVVAGGRSEDIRSAGASLESARAKLDDLKAGPKADELAIAQAAVDNAKSNLKTARIKLDSLLNPTPEDLASAQASLDSVRATLESAQARLELLTNPRSTDLIVSQARLDSAKASLKSAQSKLEELLAGATVAELASAEALVEAARIRLTNAKVDMDQLRTKLNDEKIRNIIDARMRLWNARQKLGEDRYRGASPEQIAADEEEILLAYRAVEVAEEDLNWPELGISAEDIIVAQGAIDEAEASLRSVTAKLGELKAGPKPQEIQSAQATVEQAKSSLASAQADLEILRYPSNSDLQSAKSSVDKAKADITSAETRLAQLKNPTPLDLASAEASVEQAQSNLRSAQVKLDQLLGGPKTVDLVAAQSSVVQAESQLTLRQSPYTNEDILTAQAQVSQAEASLAEAVLNQEGSTLYAPFAGVVSAVNITPQRSAGSGAGSVAVAISILDPTAFKVDLDVDESEVAKVDLDQSATITFDSLTGRRFRGKVIAIAPQATTASGVTSYQVSLGIGEGQGIKAGMTAFAEIVYASKENVITVPSRAVTRQGRNQMVKVMVDGKPQAKEVKTGITDGSKIEVVEGLQEGEQVVIPNSTAPAQGTANTRVPGAGFGGGGPGLAPGGFPAGGARR